MTNDHHPTRVVDGLARRADRPVALLRSNRDQGVSPEASPAAPNGGGPSAPPPAPPPAAGYVGGPKYLRLQRRETRVFEDQADALRQLTTTLNRARRRSDGTTVGERLTDNTLVRIAIDLLLTNAHNLKGATELELAASLGLPAKPGRPV